MFISSKFTKNLHIYTTNKNASLVIISLNSQTLQVAILQLVLLSHRNVLLLGVRCVTSPKHTQKGRPDDAALHATLRGKFKLQRVATIETVARNIAGNIARIELDSTCATLSKNFIEFQRVVTLG